MNADTIQRLQEQFGEVSTIPLSMSSALQGEIAYAFDDGSDFTLYFPYILDNQKLTPIYDKIFEQFPKSSASHTARGQRIIQIPSPIIHDRS